MSGSTLDCEDSKKQIKARGRICNPVWIASFTRILEVSCNAKKEWFRCLVLEFYPLWLYLYACWRVCMYACVPYSADPFLVCPSICGWQDELLAALHSELNSRPTAKQWEDLRKQLKMLQVRSGQATQDAAGEVRSGTVQGIILSRRHTG